VSRAAWAVHVIIVVWEPRAPSRHKIRCRTRLAKSGFNCELPRVLAVCRSHEASPSQARKKMTDKTKRTDIMPDRFIRTAVAADAERCLAALTLAFSSDPPCRWAWPDPQQYLEAFPHFARAFGGWAIDHGTAYYYEGFSGVALWLPPGAAPDEESLVKVIENKVAAERKGAMFSMFEQMDALHPQEAHWYLPLIGVDPAHQGKGIGSALLSQILNVCDGQNVLAYLEATSPRNIPLYERHGFEAIGSVQVADSPQIIPMLRKPRPMS
jgi:GNAT superfamily N-acetyltransferase